jgi:peptidyl-prolyl cis-trans isomerase C
VIRILPLACAALVFTACSRSAPAAASSETAAPQTTAAPASAAPAPPPPVAPVSAQLPDIVARVNGEAVTRAELETAVGELEARAGQPVPAEQRDRVLRGVLDQLIGYRLLLQETVARKVAVPDAEVAARLDQIRSQFPTEEAFQQTLQERKMTLAGLRDDTRDGMRISAMLEAEVGAKAAVTPQQVMEFYEKNPSEFQQGERLRASHILVRVQANADAAEREAARAKAAGILAEVKAGKDFAALAKQHSDDPGSGANGGDLGFFERGQMVGPFEQAAFAMQPGQTSELVQSDFGFHIIRTVERQPARTVPLTEVSPRIEEFLSGQRREEQTRAFVESLRAKGKVEVLI